MASISPNKVFKFRFLFFHTMLPHEFQVSPFKILKYKYYFMLCLFLAYLKTVVNA